MNYPSIFLFSNFFSFKLEAIGLGHNIGYSVGWVERSETQQLIDVGFRSSTQPTKNPYGLKFDQGQAIFQCQKVKMLSD